MRKAGLHSKGPKGGIRRSFISTFVGNFILLTILSFRRLPIWLCDLYGPFLPVSFCRSFGTIGRYAPFWICERSSSANSFDEESSWKSTDDHSQSIEANRIRETQWELQHTKNKLHYSRVPLVIFLSSFLLGTWLFFSCTHFPQTENRNNLEDSPLLASAACFLK